MNKASTFYHRSGLIPTYERPEQIVSDRGCKNIFHAKNAGRARLVPMGDAGRIGKRRHRSNLIPERIGAARRRGVSIRKRGAERL